jgi:hypothetical protein
MRLKVVAYTSGKIWSLAFPWWKRYTWNMFDRGAKYRNHGEKKEDRISVWYTEADILNCSEFLQFYHNYF